MKNFNQLLLLLTIVFVVACNRNAPKSFKITSSGDTINLVDANGLKQGLWLMPNNKDTMIWLNDTGHAVGVITSGEIFRLLKENGNKGVMPFEKVDGHYVAPNPDSVKIGS